MKKTFLTFALLLGTFAFQAQAAGNTKGFLWGGADNGSGIPSGLGWVSMSSDNCDQNVDGFSDTPATAGCPASGTAIPSYGVNIPSANGDLSGYAWSSNYGWIAFENAAPKNYLTGCPFLIDGTCNAHRVGNELRGWARFAAVADALALGNSGGNEGWIKLNDATNTLYGVKIDAATGALTSHAWSNEAGYIKFTGATTAATCVSAWVPAFDPATQCTSSSVVQNDGCGNTQVVSGTKTDGICCPVNSCGSATMTGSGIAPAADLCGGSSTTSSSVLDAGANWTWSCSNGCFGETVQNCQTPHTANAEYGNWREVAP